MGDDVIQQLVMVMDMHGYEQDGDGPEFANMNERGAPVRFSTWQDVYDFVVSNFAKRKEGRGVAGC